MCLTAVHVKEFLRKKIVSSIIACRSIYATSALAKLLTRSSYTSHHQRQPPSPLPVPRAPRLTTQRSLQMSATPRNELKAMRIS